MTQELREVIKLGVDLIQGYYTSRPQPYVVRSIDERVMNEIVQYNQSLNARLYKKEYETDYNDTVSMVQLAANKYTSIKVKKARESIKDHNQRFCRLPAEYTDVCRRWIPWYHHT